MTKEQAFHIGEVRERGEHRVVAEIDDTLHGPPPPFGSLVKIDAGSEWIFGLISDATVSEVNVKEALSRHIPPVMHRRIDDRYVESRKIEVGIVLLGSQAKHGPGGPARRHAEDLAAASMAVFLPSEEELEWFALELAFLRDLVSLPSSLPIDALIITSLKRFSTVVPDPASYLVRACEELGRLLLQDGARVLGIVNHVMLPGQKTGSDAESRS